MRRTNGSGGHMAEEAFRDAPKILSLCPDHYYVAAECATCTPKYPAEAETAPEQRSLVRPRAAASAAETNVHGRTWANGSFLAAGTPEPYCAAHNVLLDDGPCPLCEQPAPEKPQRPLIRRRPAAPPAPPRSEKTKETPRRRLFHDRLASTEHGPESATGRHFLLQLSLYGNENGACIFPSQQTIAAAMGVNVRTVQRLELIAEKLKWIERYPRKAHSGAWIGYEYRLLLEGEKGPWGLGRQPGGSRHNAGRVSAHNREGGLGTQPGSPGAGYKTSRLSVRDLPVVCRTTSKDQRYLPKNSGAARAKAAGATPQKQTANPALPRRPLIRKKGAA